MGEVYRSGIIGLAWLAAANFLVILEVPCTAVPLWALYGATYAYNRPSKEKEQSITQ